MTAPTTTQSVVGRSTTGSSTEGDSPAVRAAARTRASVGVTQRKSKPSGAVGRLLASWWAWTARPPSLRATWRLSRVAQSRVPLGSSPLVLLWRISNWTDRPVLFLLAFVAPPGLQGPVRWLVQRPTRRWLFYLILGGLAAMYLIR